MRRETETMRGTKELRDNEINCSQFIHKTQHECRYRRQYRLRPISVHSHNTKRFTCAATKDIFGGMRDISEANLLLTDCVCVCVVVYSSYRSLLKSLVFSFYVWQSQEFARGISQFVRSAKCTICWVVVIVRTSRAHWLWLCNDSTLFATRNQATTTEEWKMEIEIKYWREDEGRIKKKPKRTVQL